MGVSCIGMSQRDDYQAGLQNTIRQIESANNLLYIIRTNFLAFTMANYGVGLRSAIDIGVMNHPMTTFALPRVEFKPIVVLLKSLSQLPICISLML